MWWVDWFGLNPRHPLQSAVIAIWPNIAAALLTTVALAVVSYFVFLKKLIFCSHKGCFRIGHHKVEGTHYRTCPKHTTKAIHTHFQEKYKAKYPKQHNF